VVPNLKPVMPIWAASQSHASISTSIPSPKPFEKEAISSGIAAAKVLGAKGITPHSESELSVVHKKSYRDTECQTDCCATQDACVSPHKIKFAEISSQTVPPDVRDVMVNTVIDEELLVPPVETASIGTNTTAPKMKDKAVLTRITNILSKSTQTKIHMVSNSVYGKALARALMAEVSK
jgi:hypothetical protein